MPEMIDWTKMLDLFQRVYLQATVMAQILAELNYDHSELERRFADPRMKQEVEKHFDLLFRASRGNASLENALQDFSKLHSIKKPN